MTRRDLPKSPANGLHKFARLSCVIVALVASSIHARAEGPAPAEPSSCTTSAAASEAADDETPFLNENAAAMDRMMAGMATKPSGDVDRDFVSMMIPHHQGAIDMAKALLRHGANERLKRLAQEIIVTQQQEIAAMRIAIGESPIAPASQPFATSSTEPTVHAHPMHTK